VLECLVVICTHCCILVIRPSDGSSFLAETRSRVLSEYNVVLPDYNIHLYSIMQRGRAILK